MPFNLGLGELLVVMIVALLVFGGRLPQVGRSLGRGILEFKEGLQGKPLLDDDEEEEEEEEEDEDEPEVAGGEGNEEEKEGGPEAEETDPAAEDQPREDREDEKKA